MTPNMLLPVPSVGITAGPQYASDINACLSLIDTHNHTAGSGVQVPSDGLDINADLTFGDNRAIDLSFVRFTPFATDESGNADLATLYVVDVDLYYRDADGVAVRLTQNGSVAGTPGSIANLLSPASAAYVALTEKFVWQSAVNTPADLDFGSAIFRNDVASGYGMTVEAPTLAADTSITLPARPSGATKILSMSTSGVMTASYTVDDATLEISSDVIREKDGGTTNAKLANMAARTIKSNATAAAAAPGDTQATGNGQVLQQSGDNVTGTLVFSKLVSDNFQAGAVDTAAIAGASVTPEKMGAQNYNTATASDSSQSGAGTKDIVSVAFTNITGNRLIEIALQGVSTVNSYIQFDDIGNTSSTMAIKFLVDGTVIHSQEAQMVHNASGYILRLPPSAFRVKTTLTPGAHTIKAQVVIGTAGIVDWINVGIIVSEA